MTATWRLRELRASDAEGMRTIFNHYVEHSLAAYAQRPLSMDEIRNLLAKCHGYPALAAEDEKGNLVGFGFLSAYSPYDTFAGTALITYFIASGHTGRGLGTAFLQELETQAREHGVCRLLAHVSSKNEGSLAFHRTHGFHECGCFHDIGCKQGELFDVEWFEKSLVDSIR
ncbi:GNAT family N-acetyltransferase [Candidatus Bipolaricaulota bacterium]